MVPRTLPEETPFHLALSVFTVLGVVWAVQVIRAPMPLEPALPDPEIARAGVLARVTERHAIPQPIMRTTPPAGSPVAPRAAPPAQPAAGRSGGTRSAPLVVPADPAGTGDVDFEAALAKAVSSVATHGDTHDALRLRAGHPPGDDADAPVLAITMGAPSASTRTEGIEVQAGTSSPLFRNDPPPDSASVGAVLRRYRGRVEACASAATRRNPHLRGRVELRWTIAEGHASDVSVRTNETRDDDLAACLRQTLLGIRYSVLEGEESASYAWIFSTD